MGITPRLCASCSVEIQRGKQVRNIVRHAVSVHLGKWHSKQAMHLNRQVVLAISTKRQMGELSREGGLRGGASGAFRGDLGSAQGLSALNHRGSILCMRRWVVTALAPWHVPPLASGEASHEDQVEAQDEMMSVLLLGMFWTQADALMDQSNARCKTPTAALAAVGLHA